MPWMHGQPEIKADQFRYQRIYEGVENQKGEYLPVNIQLWQVLPIAQGLETRAEGFHSAYRIRNKDGKLTSIWWGGNPPNPPYTFKEIRKDLEGRVLKEKGRGIGGGDTRPTPLLIYCQNKRDQRVTGYCP